MSVRYNNPWKLLVDRKKSKAVLRRTADTSFNTLTKRRRDKGVSLSSLDRTCETLKMGCIDIFEHLEEVQVVQP